MKKLLTILPLLSLLFGGCQNQKSFEENENKESSQSIESSQATQALEAPILTKLQAYLQEQKPTILVPLYLYPYSDSLEWRKFIDYKEVHPEIEMMAIANPSNGDFDESNPNHRAMIERLTASGIKVIGYVYTKYATRDIDKVKANLDSWAEFYKEVGVDGIFFDEATDDEEEGLAYYQELYKHCKELDLNFVVLNPGARVDASYIDNGAADMIVTIESKSVLDKTKWNKKGSQTALGMLIYYMDEDELDETIDIAIEHEFEYIYFIEKNDNSRWNTFSAYFALDKPWEIEKFKPALSESKLEVLSTTYDPLWSADYGEFEDIAHRYFYAENSNMHFKMCSEDSQRKMSRLSFEDSFETNSSQLKSLESSFKMIDSTATDGVTLMELYSDDALKSLIEIRYEDEKLWAIHKDARVDLNETAQDFTDIKISVEENKLTVFVNDTLKIDDLNVTYWKGNKSYFKTGVTLQNGCAHTAVSTLTN